MKKLLVECAAIRDICDFTKITIAWNVVCVKDGGVLELTWGREVGEPRGPYGTPKPPQQTFWWVVWPLPLLKGCKHT